MIVPDAISDPCAPPTIVIDIIITTSSGIEVKRGLIIAPVKLCANFREFPIRSIDSVKSKEDIIKSNKDKIRFNIIYTTSYISLVENIWGYLGN
jgi:hypothetical protein